MRLVVQESPQNQRIRKLKEEQNLYLHLDGEYLSIWDYDIEIFPVVKFNRNADHSYTLIHSNYDLPPEFDIMENINILPALLNYIKRNI